jgi:hypothetical protein
MELKNKTFTRSLKFNFELNKNIFNGSVFIENHDIQMHGLLIHDDFIDINL